MWLLCRVAQGLFPDEFAVSVQAEGGVLSLFVPQRQVRLAGNAPASGLVDGRLRVDLLDEDDRFGLVALPASAIEGGRTAKVQRHLLLAQ